MRASGLFSGVKTSDSYYDEANHATIKGISIKTLILLVITIASAVIVAIFLPDLLADESKVRSFYILLIVSCIATLICGLAGRFENAASKYFAAFYSLFEGISLGFITRLVEEYFPGAGYLCISATLAIFAIMVILYATGIMRASKGIMRVMIALLLGALALTLITIICRIFFDYSSSMFYICLVIELALLFYGVISLTFDFAEAEYTVKAGCSKNAEWCVALGLEISLVYIYIQLLRVVVMIAGNRK